MKLRYFIPLFALLGVLASCSEDEMTLLDEIRVSTSYVAIDMGGGSTTITLDAKQDWAFDNIFKKTVSNDDGTKTDLYEPLPDWLTVSQLSGPAGTTQLTFSAETTIDGRSAELRILCGGKTQIINVIQGLSTISDATCAEVIAGPESKTYRVTGTVKSIVNTTYGNWYLVDDTGEIYIYGTLDAKGATKNFLSLGLEVGDVVTVEGPKTVYNGTVELVDVTVVSIQKSLVKVESIDPENATVSKEGGDVTVTLSCKGDGVSVEVPEDAKDWLAISSVTSGESPVVKFHARANDGGMRETVITFRTTSGGKEYTSQATIKQEGSIVDVTVADFLAAEEGSTQYRITGVITEVANATYGNVYVADWSGTAYVFGIGAKGDFAASGLKAGDVVTLVGTRSAYNGNPQMAKAALESFIVVTPISIADFLDLPDNDDDYYMVSGFINAIDNPIYGNLYLSDGDNLLYVYGTYPGWGATGDNRKNLLETLGLDVGDDITIIGTKTTYNGKIELKNGIYFPGTPPELARRR